MEDGSRPLRQNPIKGSRGAECCRCLARHLTCPLLPVPRDFRFQGTGQMSSLPDTSDRQGFQANEKMKSGWKMATVRLGALV
jgi:hypothetical protein